MRESFGFVHEFATIPAATSKFFSTLPAIDLSHLIGAELLQRTVVSHAASMHFLYQRLVPTTNGMNLQQTFLEETSERLLSHQTANEHVQLDMFTKEMFPAHQPWVNHPHSHFAYFTEQP